MRRTNKTTETTPTRIYADTAWCVREFIDVTRARIAALLGHAVTKGEFLGMLAGNVDPDVRAKLIEAGFQIPTMEVIQNAARGSQTAA